MRQYDIMHTIKNTQISMPLCGKRQRGMGLRSVVILFLFIS